MNHARWLVSAMN